MHVIARPAINAAIQKFPNAATWLTAWWSRAGAANWMSLDDVRKDYPSVDQVGRCLVFNVCGNNYRFIVGVAYSDKTRNGTLYVWNFLTHAEYDKDTWKKDC